MVWISILWPRIGSCGLAVEPARPCPSPPRLRLTGMALLLCSVALAGKRRKGALAAIMLSNVVNLGDYNGYDRQENGVTRAPSSRTPETNPTRLTM